MKKLKIALLALVLYVSIFGVSFAGGYMGISYAEDTKQTTTKEEDTNVVNTSTTDEKTNLSKIAEKNQKSVVEINTETVMRDRFYGNYVSEGAGSGVIIRENGYIITNYHVVEDARTIYVTLANGKQYEAEYLGGDEKNDIAVLKIDKDNLDAAQIGDSDQLVVGESVLAIGNPLGQLGGSVTEGIISSTSREITIDGKTMELLQTSAAINPGNSGGGLFDVSGKLIGIVNAKSSGSDIEGLGFAIPINTALEIAEQIVDDSN